MNQASDMVTNSMGILLGTALVLIWSANCISAVSTAMVCFGELIFHTNMAIQLIRYTNEFHFYSPGLVTSICGFLPIGCWIIYLLIKKYHIRVRQLLLGILAGMVVLVSCIIMPEKLMKNEDTPYAFKDAGYYTFLEE